MNEKDVFVMRAIIRGLSDSLKKEADAKREKPLFSDCTDKLAWFGEGVVVKVNSCCPECGEVTCSLVKMADTDVMMYDPESSLMFIMNKVFFVDKKNKNFYEVSEFTIDCEDLTFM